MKSTIMDNAKSDLIVVSMVLEYYDIFRDKDIKRIACYHLNCCLKKIFLAILSNDDGSIYYELVKENVKSLYKMINSYIIPENISRYIDSIHEWNENIIFVSDFRPNIDLIKQLYNEISSFFDNIFDKNVVI